MIHTGFKKPIIDKTHYRLGFGQVPSPILKESGNWESGLPITEKQRNDFFDTFNCTGFGTASLLETLMKAVYGIDVNYSDRWIGIISGTSVENGGNDPHTVFEAIRKHGLIPESMLPFDESIDTPEKYYSFYGADENACRIAGKKWLEEFDFKHEWVFLPDQPLDEKMNNIKTALKYSPLGIAVYAWATDERGIYVQIGDFNHWTVMYNCDQFQRIFDTYEPFKKALEQDLVYCKRISITKKVKPVVTKSVWQDFLTWLLKLLNSFKW